MWRAGFRNGDSRLNKLDPVSAILSHGTIRDIENPLNKHG